MNHAIAGLCILMFVTACERPRDDTLNGYVEVEPVRVAAPLAGRLTQLAVRRGETVARDAPLFVLDAEREAAAVREAEARVAKAEAQAADLAKGKRSDELAAIVSSAEVARAALHQSEAELARQRKLADAGFVSPNRLADLQARRDADAAQVRGVEAELRTARLAARGDQQRAAQAEVRAAAAALAQSRWNLEQKSVRSRIAARVEDTYFREGEWVSAGTPVVSLLEPDAVKLRFFIPQAMLSRVKPGARVKVSCDGCAGPIPAIVRHVASEAEFTPPVIYSRENRARLVFLVEAWPSAADAARLHPGQPVDIRLEQVQ